jgi:thioesterase domain-containing protein
VQSTTKEQKIKSIEEMAKKYISAIDELEDKSDSSYCFAGWSMGALVAFEMAVIFENKNKKQVPVIILDQLAPSKDDAVDFYPSEVDRLVLFVSKVEHLVQNKIQITKEDLEGKTPLEQSQLFLTEFKLNNLVPKDVSVNDFHGFLEKMIHHNEITTLYAGKKYAGDVLLIKATDSTFVNSKRQENLNYAWDNYTDENLTRIEVSGNHVSMMRSPYVENLASILTAYLKKNLTNN